MVRTAEELKVMDGYHTLSYGAYIVHRDRQYDIHGFIHVLGEAVYYVTINGKVISSDFSTSPLGFHEMCWIDTKSTTRHRPCIALGL